jgi:hypothetical protein
MENHQNQETLKNATLILILGILSIVTCCCYGIVGLILGITTLFLAYSATKTYNENPELYKGFQNVKIGKILAIIGLVLSVLYLLFVIFIILTFGMDTLQDQQLMQEKMQEFIIQNQ